MCLWWRYWERLVINTLCPKSANRCFLPLLSWSPSVKIKQSHSTEMGFNATLAGALRMSKTQRLIRRGAAAEAPLTPFVCRVAARLCYWFICGLKSILQHVFVLLRREPSDFRVNVRPSESQKIINEPSAWLTFVTWGKWREFSSACSLFHGETPRCCVLSTSALICFSFVSRHGSAMVMCRCVKKRWRS